MKAIKKLNGRKIISILPSHVWDMQKRKGLLPDLTVQELFLFP